MEKKHCQECQAEYYGRSDKKFCSDICRNSFNNRLRSEENVYISKINTILKRNRRILAQINPEGKKIIQREKLLSKGFNFSYFTNLYKTNSGKEYFFCYDQGYLKVDEDKVKVVLKGEYVDER